MVARRAKQAKKNGVVSKSEIENMRSMLHMGGLTKKKDIREYQFRFNMGSSSVHDELPIFLMFKYLPREQMVEMVRSAEQRGE
jgi:hypothetical protein